MCKLFVDIRVKINIMLKSNFVFTAKCVTAK